MFKASGGDGLLQDAQEKEKMNLKEQTEKAVARQAQLKKKTKAEVFAVFQGTLGKVNSARIEEQRKDYMIYDILRSEFGDEVLNQDEGQTFLSGRTKMNTTLPFPKSRLVKRNLLHAETLLFKIQQLLSKIEEVSIDAVAEVRAAQAPDLESAYNLAGEQAETLSKVEELRNGISALLGDIRNSGAHAGL